jgi:5'-nucleotidase
MVALALALAVLAGCSGGDDSSATSSAPPVSGPASTESVSAPPATEAPGNDPPATEPPATEPPATDPPATDAPPEVMQVLVTNDDGVGAAGIDALVQGLLTLDFVEVTVVAPATNQSGTGRSLTAGPLTVTDAATLSGYPAKAVAGFPADTIVWAIDQGGISFVPDVVISGINFGQNYTIPILDASGTIGAARAAAARGIPALAASQFVVGDQADFPAGVQAVLEWLTSRSAEIMRDAAATSFDNLNIPTCVTGSIQGTVEVPVGELGAGDYSAIDCTSAVEPVDDVTGLQAGYITLSEVAVGP